MRPALMFVASVTLVACKEGAVELRVTGSEPLGVTEVELFAGIHSPTIGELRPAAHSTPLSVAWWQRDRTWDRDIATVDNGLATFAYLSGGEDDTIKSVVVVGYRDGVPVAAATRLEPTVIPDDMIHRHELPLVGIEPLPRRPGSMPAAVGLLAWGPSDDPRACVAVDNVPLESVDATTAVIGTPGDPDCDGLFKDDSRECVDNEYMGRLPTRRGELSCARSEQVTNPVTNLLVDLCLAGGPACVDGIGQHSCQPSSYCAPRAICERCTGVDCDVRPYLGELSHIECTFPTTDPTPGVIEFCPATATLDLSPADSQLAGISCADNAVVRGPGDAFGQQINFGGGSIQLQTVDASTCAYRLTAGGQAPDGGMFGATLGVFAVTLVGPVAGRGLTLPVVIKQNPQGCLQTQVCAFKQKLPETLGVCVRQPVVPGSVPVD